MKFENSNFTQNVSADSHKKSLQNHKKKISFELNDY